MMEREMFERILSDKIIDVAFESPHTMWIGKQEVEMNGKAFSGMLIHCSSKKGQTLVLNLDELFRRYSGGTPLNEIANYGLKVLNLPLIGNNKAAEIPQEACFLSKAA